MYQAPQAALQIARALRSAGYPTYFVGGCVRDVMLNRAPKDWDLASAATPDQVHEVCGKDFKVVDTGREFGTVTVVGDGLGFEVTTFRGEADYDGRRPAGVHFIGTILGDLARRDFTINAMALNPSSGEIVDPFNGRQALEAKRIVAVGDAATRFKEDGLRIIRAFRFASQLGFQLDYALLDAVPGALKSLESVSQERKTQELRKLLLGTDPAGALHMMARVCPNAFGHTDLGVMHTINLNRVPAVEELRLASLFNGFSNASTVSTMTNMKFPKNLVVTVSNVVQAEFMAAGALDGWQRRRALSFMKMNDVALSDVTAVLYAHDREQDGFLLQREAETYPPLTYKDLAISSDEIVHLAGGPGRKVGVIQRALLNAVIFEPSQNTPAELFEIAGQAARD